MSAKLLQCIEPTLRSFYIFNSNLCRKEGEEHKKILYYYPENIEINTKIKDVGLVEAILGFTSTFTDTIEGCKALNTQKTTQLFYQPEPGYWMVIAVNKAKEVRTKDGIEITEYRAVDAHDAVYRNLLLQLYKLFHLLEGPFEKHNVQENTESETENVILIKKLSAFFNQHLSTLVFPINQPLALTNSTEYLTLDKLLFLRSHNVANIISAAFPAIDDILLYYKQTIICSNKLNPKDISCLHGYITHILDKRTDESRSHKKGVFLMGNLVVSENLKSNVIQKSERIYLLDENGVLTSYYLLIYTNLHISACMLIKANNVEEFEQAVPEDFYMDLHTLAEPYLSSLSNDIKELLSRRDEEKLLSTNSKLLLLPTSSSSSSSSSTLTIIFGKSGTFDNADAITPKFIFINDLSFKHITNIASDRYIHQLNASEKSDCLPQNIMNILADLLALPKKEFSFEEVIVKTTNEFWIVAHYCNNRQFIVIVKNNKATLLDVSSEIKRLFDLYMPFDIMFDFQ